MGTSTIAESLGVDNARMDNDSERESSSSRPAAQFVGDVIKGPFATGSKSAHEAVLLKTDEHQYVLRRQGGNPFVDSELEALVGKRIRGHGKLSGTTLILSDYVIVTA